MRRPIIAGNWKMNKTVSAAVELAKGIKEQLRLMTQVDIVICPPYLCLKEVDDVISNSNIYLGAQDMFWEPQGAYTGEIAAVMLKDVGCKYVILGHSERRTYFGETDENVNKKIKAAIGNNIISIVCIGETLQQRDNQETFDVVGRQLEHCLHGLKPDIASKIIIAYEPVWAIGTGRNATPQQAQEVHGFIRELLAKILDKKSASFIRIQYGGSVKPENARDLLTQPDIDGALVGGASLDLKSFVDIVRSSE